MSHFFIDRPVFASVIAIFIMLTGLLATISMPVAQFPKMTPPTISLIVEYSGASAQTMQDSIAQVIEQRMVGLDDLLYITTNSSSEGRMLMRMTFQPEVNPDMAQMQVQNRLQLALPLLPETVKNQGIRVRKISDTFLNFYSFRDESGLIAAEEIADFIASTLFDPLCGKEAAVEHCLPVQFAVGEASVHRLYRRLVRRFLCMHADIFFD